MNIATTLRQITVLQRSGVIDLYRPWRAVAKSRATREYGPLAGAVRFGAQFYPDRTALIAAGTRFTYRELDERTTAVAAAWQAKGIGDASRIGLLSRDDADLVVAMIASAKTGSRAVLMNTGFGADQFAEVAGREGVTAIYAQPEFDDTIDGVRVPRLTTTEVGGVRSLQPPVTCGEFVILTGGTTGTPKGVPRRISSPLAAAQFLDRVPLSADDTLLLCAPLFHGTAYSQMLMAVSAGGTVVVHGRFDAADALADIVEYRCTAAVMVPTMLRRILAVPDAPTEQIRTSLRILFSAGEALPIDVGNRIVDQFGPVIYNYYGCTETGTATIATPEDWLAAPGTVGKPPVGIDVMILDEDGTCTASGSVYVRNPIAFAGYTDGHDKKRLGEYIDTGDLGHFDTDGRLFIDGRNDDMIVSGGENVFPGEVEDVIAAMPGVQEVAVVGVPDDGFGQRLAAHVVGDGVSADTVREEVRARLARYKVPRDVVFQDRLPRSETGKVLRRELRQLGPARNVESSTEAP